MKKWISWMPIVALLCLIAVGCGGKDEKKEEKKDATSQKVGTTPAGNFACTACGETAAEGHVCKTDAEVCEDCKLHEGSALCCKVAPENMAELKSGKRLCMACGHIAEEGHKCDASHEKCEKCGKHADSILCNCKAAADLDENDESGS